MCADSLQSCQTLCSPMNHNPAGSSVCGIFQARILKWAAIPPPRGLLDPGIKPTPHASPALLVGSLPDELWEKPRRSWGGHQSFCCRQRASLSSRPCVMLTGSGCLMSGVCASQVYLTCPPDRAELAQS